jgi:uncharacterized protein YjiS (DUF1127 family)
MRWTKMYAENAARRKSRKVLARLDDHMLEDIGLTRTMAQVEATKRFWRD